ncbi:MAG: hypothetical protein PHS95_03470 [Candidatus Pacebacteria bacterium]|nr:hypothetical protein [Candidatus Paceibacterota bacterium]
MEPVETPPAVKPTLTHSPKNFFQRVKEALKRMPNSTQWYIDEAKDDDRWD